MTKREIFKAAHKLAKTFEGDYSACLSLALSQIYSDMKNEEKANTFNYKGVVVEFNNITKQSQLWSLGGVAKRVWTVNGAKAWVVTIDGVQRLATNLNGSKQTTILANFDFPVEPFLTEKQQQQLVEKAGYTYQHAITEY